jgi:hypothetical protein
MADTDPAVSSGAETSQAIPESRAGAGELSKAIVEAIASAQGDGVSLDALKRNVSEALDEPLAGFFEEQLDVLLTNNYVERDTPKGAYKLAPAGKWLVQGFEVVHG